MGWAKNSGYKVSEHKPTKAINGVSGRRKPPGVDPPWSRPESGKREKVPQEGELGGGGGGEEGDVYV